MLLLENSYFNVELYYNNEIVGFAPSGRIALTDDYRIDWKNISFFRKAVFSHQMPRQYLIKVYLVNPIIGDEKEFIGFQNIDLEEDAEVHINCKSQGKIDLIFNSQNNEGVKNVETHVLKDDFVVQKSYSGTDGNITIGLPVGLSEKYVLKYYYKGFLIDEEEINLNFLNNLFPIKKNIDVEVYDFEVKISDPSGGKPDLDLEISMTSGNMQNPVVLTPDSYENGVYSFEKIVPAEYNLTIEYDSTKVTETINIPEIDSFEVTLNDLTIGLKDLWDFDFKSDEVLVFLKGFNFTVKSI